MAGGQVVGRMGGWEYGNGNRDQSALAKVEVEKEFG